MNPTENKKTVPQTPEQVLDDLSENKSPTPSTAVENKVIEEIMKGKDTQVIEMPTPEEDQKTEPPQEAPKVSVPNPPRAPAQQKLISVSLQTENVGKKVCMMKGHEIHGVPLRTMQQSKDGVPMMFEQTIVICIHCGASLAQIRG